MQLNQMDLDKQTTLIEHYFSMGRYRQALALLDKTQSVFPGDGQLHYLRALCTYCQGAFPKAAEHCERALAAGFAPADCRRLRASIFMAEGKWDQARVWIDRSLEHQPENPITLSKKAIILSRQGDSDLAAALMEKMLSEHPDNETVVELGVFFYDNYETGQWLKNEKRRKNLLETLITLNPDNKIALDHLEELYLVKNRIGKAKKITAQKVSLYPEENRDFSYRKVTPWTRLVFLVIRGIMRVHAIISRLFKWTFKKQGLAAGVAIWIAASIWLGFPAGTAIAAGYFLTIPAVMLLFIAVAAVLKRIGVGPKDTDRNQEAA